jgi:hypothetical protein
VGLLVLGPALWQLNLALFRVIFGPLERADFLPELPCEHQQLDDAPKVVVAGGLPDVGLLGLAQDPGALVGL